MCGIGLIPAGELIDTLTNQTDRGLDSIGIIDFSTNTLYQAIKENDILPYRNWIRQVKENLKDDTPVFLHHRKASVGSVSLENTHPFIGKKFALAQNGTSKEFFDTYKYVYNKETDSECLLDYLEENCNTLLECADALDEIEDTLGNIFIFHKGKCLFYSDSTRETHLVVEREYADLSEEEREKAEKKKPGKSWLRKVVNYHPDKTRTGCRNGCIFIFNVKTGLIHSEFHYGDYYNADVYSTATAHGGKTSKRTRVTKKKDGSGHSSDSDDPRTRGTPDPLGEKMKKETAKKTGEVETKTKSEQAQLQIKITDELLKIRTMDEKDMISKIFDLIKNTPGHTGYNSKAQLGIAQNIYDTYTELHKSSNLAHICKDVFGLMPQYKASIMSTLYFLPYELLSGFSIGMAEDININLVRHTKILSTLEPDIISEYYEILQYFIENQDLYTEPDQFHTPLGVNTFLQIMFSITEDWEGYYFWNYLNDIDKGTDEDAARIEETSHNVEMYIMTAWALNIGYKHLMVNQDIYDATIANIQ